MSEYGTQLEVGLSFIFIFPSPRVLVFTPRSYARQMHEDAPCPLRLCDGCPLQQGRDTYRLLCT